jgi:hypothetical protein
MDVSPANEQEFNRWYDKEHLIERVGINGFLEARRYVAVSATPKYLNLYTTVIPELLTSQSYQEVLKNQTAWSQRVIAMFQYRIRAVLRVTASYGRGRGGAAFWGRLKTSPEEREPLRQKFLPHLGPITDRDGVISAHLLQADSSGASASDVDSFVLIDGTDAAVLEAVGKELLGPSGANVEDAVVSTGSYRLLWDLSKSELGR